MEKFGLKKIYITFAPAITMIALVIGLWCNGNTPVFGTVIQGSSPCGPTKKLLKWEAFFIRGKSKV